MSDQTMIYQGTERTLKANQSPLQLFKGPESKIKQLGLQDGALYFATDTKKIYLDCDFTDSVGTKLKDRMTFGGSTGIFYAKKTFTQTEIDIANFIFTQDDLDNAAEVPMVDDLILNDGDGSFYRITEVEDESTSTIKEYTLKADRLTVSGSGGGGGGGGGGTAAITFGVVGGSTKYWAYDETYMPISFYATLAEPDETIGYRIYIGDSSVPRLTVSGRPQSTKENPTVFDLSVLKEYFRDFMNNQVTVRVMLFGDDGTEASRALKFSITMFQLRLVANQEELPPQTTRYTNYGVITYFGSTLINPKIIWSVTDLRNNVLDLGQIDLIAQNNGQTVVFDVGERAPGTYHIISYIKAELPDGLGGVITSAVLDQLCSWVNDEQIILSVTFPTQNYKQFDTITMPYIVYYGQASVAIKLYVIYTNEAGEKTTTLIDNLSVNTGERQNWIYTFANKGTYQFRVVAGDNAVTDTSNEYVVSGVSAEVPVLATSGLELYLTPIKTNNSVNKEVWLNEGSATYVNDNDEVVPVDVSFENVNWVSNGWGVDENNVPIMRLNNAAKMVVNGYTPFPSSGIARRDGRTIELDLKISNIKDREASLMTCWSVGSKIEVGLQANGHFICLNSSGLQPSKHWVDGSNEEDDISGKIVKTIPSNETGLVAYYAEGERVHVTFVITPYGSGNVDTMPKGFVYTYINGILSGLVPYESNTFTDAAAVALASRFTFDSTNADIDIYGIRVYNIPLNDSTVLNNYLATLGDPNQAAILYQANKILNEEGRISLSAVKALGTIPYLVLRGGRQCSKKLGQFEGLGAADEVDLPGGQDKNAKDHSNGKYDFRFMEAYYYNPLTNYAIGDSTHRKIVSVYAQGTSSLQYPVKNLRIKFWKSKSNQETATPLFDGNGDAKKDKVKIYAEQPAAASVYTAKADYMDSSSAHNTGTGNALVELYGNHRSLAQMIDNSKLTAITGIPMVIFWRRYRHEVVNNVSENFNETDIVHNGIKPVDEMTDVDSDYEYIGRYNFDLDKSEAALFGFEQNEDQHYGVRLATDNVYADIAGTGSIVPKLQNIPIQEGSFRALIDDDDDLTYDPEKTYYTTPSLDGPVWTTNKTGSDADKDLGNRLKIGPLYLYTTDAVNSIECWEVLDNNKNLGTKELQWFQDPWTPEDDPQGQNFTELFESRYPEYSEQNAADRRSFVRFINWVASTNCMRVGHEPTLIEIQNYEASLSTDNPLSWPDDLKPLYPDENNPNIPAKENGVYKGINGLLYKEDPMGKTVRGVKNCKQDTEPMTFYYDSFEYRLHKFKSEFHDYMIEDMTLIYYIMTELLVAKDSRAKNMMLCCFDANPERGTGHWYPIFYDMDTILGLDNVGKLRYRYDEEDYNYGVINANADYYSEDGSTIAVNYSVLWTNIRRTMYNEIAALYHEMRGSTLNYNNLVNIYNTRLADSWNATMINQDIWYKFVRFLTGYHNPADGNNGVNLSYAATDGVTSANWLPAVQGTRSLHRKQFLRRRLSYLDGKYNYVLGGAVITTRDTGSLSSAQADIDEGRELTRGYLKITFQDSGYLSVDIGNGVVVGPFKMTENTPNVLHIHNATGDEQPGNFQFANLISDLGDLSSQRYSVFGPSENPLYPMHLRNLNFSDGRVNYSATFADIREDKMITSLNNMGAFPYLEVLQVSYMSKLGNFTLEKNPYIREVYAYGTASNDITFPQGGVLHIVHLPKVLGTLKIEGHPMLSELLMENDDWSNLTTLYIVNCPLVDTQTIFNKMNLNLATSVYLPDIKWTFNKEDVELTDNMIVRIPLLDKLLEANGANGESARNARNELVVGRSYVGGTIIINNGTDDDANAFGVNENALYNTYGQYYPNLNFEFTHNALSKPAYTFAAYDNSGKLILQRKFQEDESGNIPDFSWENIFTPSNNDYILPEQVRADDIQYTYKFIGWNTTGALIYIEEGDEDYTAEQAQYYAANSVVAHYSYDNHVYDKVGVSQTFDKTNFDAETRTLKVYPTFVGLVRTHDVLFYDSDNASTAAVYEIQAVRHGSYAHELATPPVRVVFDSNDMNKTDVYQVVSYRISGTSSSLDQFPITSDTVKVYPVYATTPTDARTLVTSQDAFEDITYYQDDPNANLSMAKAWGARITIPESYNQEYIVIPKQVKVSGSMRNVICLLNKNKKLKRVYFEGEHNHPLRELPDASEYTGTIAFTIQPQLEFIDLMQCPNLYRIGNFNSNEYGVFRDCRSLHMTELPDSVRVIGANAFNMHNSSHIEAFPPLTNEQKAQYPTLHLKLTKLPARLTYIQNNAFDACTSLAYVQMPDNTIKEFGANCFAGCTNLNFQSSFYFANTEIIHDRAFENCTSLQTFIAIDDSGQISTPNSLTKIGNKAFYGCTSLVPKYVYGTKLRTIGDEAFAQCGRIKIATRFQAPSAQLFTVGKNVFNDDKIYTLRKNENNIEEIVYDGNDAVTPLYISITQPKSTYTYTQSSNGNTGLDPNVFTGLNVGNITFPTPPPYGTYPYKNHGSLPVYQAGTLGDITNQYRIEIFVDPAILPKNSNNEILDTNGNVINLGEDISDWKLIPWLADETNAWNAVFTNMENNGQIKYWYVKTDANSEDYALHSNTRVYLA